MPSNQVRFQPWGGAIEDILLEALREAADSGAPVKIRLFVAYVNRAGVERLEGHLRAALATGGSMTVWCHAVAHPTRQINTAQGVAALQELGATVLLVHAAAREMHMKVFAVEFGDSVFVLIGSANLTASALVSNMEAVAVMRGKRDEPEIAAVLAQIGDVHLALSRDGAPVTRLDGPIFENEEALLLLRDVEHPGYGFGPFESVDQAIKDTPYEDEH
jgi:phosphatidylserine/phosphatidylglycerophosphate/cardiolipin synthase-like enzyme